MASNRATERAVLATVNAAIAAAVAVGTAWLARPSAAPQRELEGTAERLVAETAALQVQVRRLGEDMDDQDERMDAIEADYGGQFKDLRTRFWTTNRLFRAELEQLQRKAEQ